MQITVRAYSAPLSDFVPVEGEWFVNRGDEGDRDEITPQVVAEAIAAQLAVPYPIEVKVFTDDGRAITGDCPWSGTFVATRV